MHVPLVAIVIAGGAALVTTPLSGGDAWFPLNTWRW